MFAFIRHLSGCTDGMINPRRNSRAITVRDHAFRGTGCCLSEGSAKLLLDMYAEIFDEELDSTAEARDGLVEVKMKSNWLADGIK
jgi:hypothetical protein